MMQLDKNATFAWMYYFMLYVQSSFLSVEIFLNQLSWRSCYIMALL